MQSLNSASPLIKLSRKLTTSEREAQSSILADTLVYLWAAGKLRGDGELQSAITNEFARWYANKDVPSVISERTIAFVDA